MYQTALELAPFALTPILACVMYFYGQHIGRKEQEIKAGDRMEAMRNSLRLGHKLRFNLEQQLANSITRTQEVEKELTHHKEHEDSDRHTLLRAARELLTASKTYQAMKSSHAQTVKRISDECFVIASRNQPPFNAPMTTAAEYGRTEEKAA